MKNKQPDKQLDLVEFLEQDELPGVQEFEEPWLGHHEPDYSLTPDRVIPLDKLKYLTYHAALKRFAEIAESQNLRLHKHFETARHYVFEVFYMIESKDDD